MHLLIYSGKCHQLFQVKRTLILFGSISSQLACRAYFSSEVDFEIERITKTINDHPFPSHALHTTLLQQIPPGAISTAFVENVLGRLFATHSNGLKAFEFFKFSLRHSQLCPSSDAFEKTLHILTRMRYFDKAWELMDEIRQTHPTLLSLKSMSIMLSRIAKFQSYDETLEAFERMEKNIFRGRTFGIDEFNVLLRAFCTQRQMKEARSVFNKLYPRFSPSTKTMNILLLGFKESGDVTAVELFYHEMIRRSFKPDTITYNIRIDAYCKKGCFGDGLKLLEDMECANCPPTIETMTTLIHGAGIARNITKAKQLFNEILTRKLVPETAVYNALMSSFLRLRDITAAASLMDEMEEKNIRLDNVTYHTMFLAFMGSIGIDGVSKLYHRMTERNFVPKTQTAVMLMKLFCNNDRLDLALDLWRYLMERGYCPHSHALDLLVRGLCARGRVEEAFSCSQQMLERGRHISEPAFRVLEKILLEIRDEEKLRKLDHLMKTLQTVLMPTKGHANGVDSINREV